MSSGGATVIAESDRSAAAYAAKFGAVFGLLVAVTDLTGWRGGVFQPWTTPGNIAENAGYFIGTFFAGAVGGAIIGAVIDFFRRTKASTWRAVGKVTLYLLGGLILLIWALAHWQSAQWVIGGIGLAFGIGRFATEHEARKALEREQLFQRLDKQNAMMGEILWRLERLDRDRGYTRD